MRECSAVAVLVEVSRDVNAYTQRSFEENIVSKLRRNSIQTAVRSVDLKPRTNTSPKILAIRFLNAHHGRCALPMFNLPRTVVVWYINLSFYYLVWVSGSLRLAPARSGSA